VCPRPSDVRRPVVVRLVRVGRWAQFRVFPLSPPATSNDDDFSDKGSCRHGCTHLGSGTLMVQHYVGKDDGKSQHHPQHPLRPFRLQPLHPLVIPNCKRAQSLVATQGARRCRRQDNLRITAKAMAEMKKTMNPRALRTATQPTSSKAQSPRKTRLAQKSNASGTSDRPISSMVLSGPEAKPCQSGWGLWVGPQTTVCGTPNHLSWFRHGESVVQPSYNQCTVNHP
jgi:hypothetical protein